MPTDPSNVHLNVHTSWYKSPFASFMECFRLSFCSQAAITPSSENIILTLVTKSGVAKAKPAATSLSRMHRHVLNL